jgi:hypothetical protein
MNFECTSGARGDSAGRRTKQGRLDANALRTVRIRASLRRKRRPRNGAPTSVQSGHAVPGTTREDLAVAGPVHPLHDGLGELWKLYQWPVREASRRAMAPAALMERCVCPRGTRRGEVAQTRFIVQSQAQPPGPPTQLRLGRGHQATRGAVAL